MQLQQNIGRIVMFYASFRLRPFRSQIIGITNTGYSNLNFS